MDKTTRYIVVAVTLVIAGLIIWKFSNIFVYIILAFVISMVGTPLVDLLQKLHIKKFHLPRSVNDNDVSVKVFNFALKSFNLLHHKICCHD